MTPPSANSATVENSFYISTFTTATDNVPKLHQVTWPVLVKSLMRHQTLDHKENAALWSPAYYTDGATRAKSAVDQVTHFVFDLDDGTTTESVAYWLDGIEHVVSSTHSHTPEHPKLRVIVRITDPIPGADYDDVWRRANQHLLHGHVDPSTKDASRMYYTPSCPPSGPKPIEIHHPGKALDWRALPALPKPKMPPKTTPKHDGEDPEFDEIRAQALLAKWERDLASMSADTGRHSRLLQLAHAAGGLVASNLLNQRDVEDALYAACQANGLPAEDGERSVVRALNDGLEDGARAPWVPDDLPDSWLSARHSARQPYGVVDLQTGEVITDALPTTSGTAEDAKAGDAEPPRLAAIPNYPIDALPGPMRELVARGSRDGLPAALVGGPALAAAAGALGANATFEVRPGTWIERAIIWVADVAPRGAGKSPGQAMGFGSIRTRDADAWGPYQEDLRQWKVNKEQGERPVDGSILFSDTNFEALVRRLNTAQDGAAAWDVDELSRVLRGLGEYKPGGGGDRGRFLELWEGSPWRYTRVGTGGHGHNAVDILIPRPTIAICGGIQTRLNHLLGGEEDGLRPRWLLHLATSTDVLDDENLSSQAHDAWAELLGRLIALRSKARRWWMSEEAWQVFFAYRRAWKRQARSDDENASTSGALDKADRQLARVALTMAEINQPGAGGELSVEVINSAAAIVDYNLDCWRALPEAAVLSLSRRDAELDKALPALAEWLEQHGGQATPRMLQRSAVAGIRTAADLMALLDRYAAIYPGSVVRTGTTARGGAPGRIVKAPPRRAVELRTYPGGVVSADKPTDTQFGGRPPAPEIETGSEQRPGVAQIPADKPPRWKVEL
jgi:hypothetical protein